MGASVVTTGFRASVPFVFEGVALLAEAYSTRIGREGPIPLTEGKGWRWSEVMASEADAVSVKRT